MGRLMEAKSPDIQSVQWIRNLSFGTFAISAATQPILSKGGGFATPTTVGYVVALCLIGVYLALGQEHAPVRSRRVFRTLPIVLPAAGLFARWLAT